MEDAGKSIYKSGLKRIDQEGLKYGKEPVSDLLIQEGVAGGYGKISSAMDALSADRVAKQKAILAEADKAGIKVDMTDSMKPIDEMIAELKASRDPKAQAVARKLEGESARYKSLDTLPEGVEGPIFPIGVQQANDFKTSIYGDLPKGAFAEAVSGKSPMYISGQKQMARGLKEGVESAAGQINKGDELKQINDELGRLLTSQDRAQAEAIKEANKNAVTSVDAMIAGANNPKMLLLKKAADIAKMTGPRTYTGRTLYNQGKGELSGPIWDLLLRHSLINAPRDEIPQK